MANKKILVTSKGCYAVRDGETVELENGQETFVDDKQAEVFVHAGKATLVLNKQKQKAD